MACGVHILFRFPSLAMDKHLLHQQQTREIESETSMFVANPFCGGDRNQYELCELEREIPKKPDPVEVR